MTWCITAMDAQISMTNIRNERQLHFSASSTNPNDFQQWCSPPSSSLRQTSECRLRRLMPSFIEMNTWNKLAIALCSLDEQRKTCTSSLCFCSAADRFSATQTSYYYRSYDEFDKENLLIYGGLFVVNGCLAAFSAGCRQIIDTHSAHIDVAVRALFAEKQRIINT